VDIDRATQGKKPFRRDDKYTQEGTNDANNTWFSAMATKEIKVSRTDPESGYMVRDDKPRGFFYLDRRTVDAKHSLITDTHVTRARMHDSQLYLARLARQHERFGFRVEAVGVDAGYFTRAVAQDLENLGVKGVMGCRTPNHKPGYFTNTTMSTTRIVMNSHGRQRFNAAVGIPRALWLREVSDAFRVSTDTPVRARFRPILFNIAPFFSICSN
jgi:hypothetical protein